MVTIHSNDINISDLGTADGAREIVLTINTLPAPVGAWYSTNPTLTFFAGLEWDASANSYKVIKRGQIRTQLELR